MFTYMSIDGSYDKLYALLDRYWDAIRSSYFKETAHLQEPWAKQMYDKTKPETFKKCLEPKKKPRPKPTANEISALETGQQQEQRGRASGINDPTPRVNPLDLSLEEEPTEKTSRTSYYWRTGDRNQ